MSKLPIQVLLLVDADADVSEGDVASLLPSERHRRRVLRLTNYGYRRPDGWTERTALNWPSLLLACRKVASDANSLGQDGHPLNIYVYGLAPLSAFLAIGVFLDTRRARVVSINRRRDGTANQEDVLDLSPGAGQPYFGRLEGLDGVSPATGRVGLFVSTRAEPAPAAATDVLVARPEGLANLVEVTSPKDAALTADNVGPCLRQLADLGVAVAANYPRSSGLTTFVLGPAPLALGLGLVLNPNQHISATRPLELTEYVAGAYSVVGRIPSSEGARELPTGPEAELRRRGVLDALLTSVAQLQEHATSEDLRIPSGLNPVAQDSDPGPAELLSQLTNLRVSREPNTDQFHINVLQGELSFGAALLQALVGVDEPVQRRLARLFTLHELVHDLQGLTSANYAGIGRAGVALEEVDYWADAFAILVAVRHEVRWRGPEGEANYQAISLDYFDAHLEALRAFDRLEQGNGPMERLPERRLRRYLIWAVQRARAKYTRTIEELKFVLDTRVHVQLAPVPGRLDEAFDKCVSGALDGTQLIVSIGGRVKRFPAQGESFDPRGLVVAVANYDEGAQVRAADYVVNEGRKLLLSWLVG